ncbi:MAG: hypothetical protein IJS12_10140 [Lachnospiraceae bacterium]|nr:hypothetical protein [Lachnospiraceae bacterium]
MESIAEFLNKIQNMIDADDLGKVPTVIQEYLSRHPEAFDERFKSELSMIEKMMDYKSNLSDWAYFRTMKLVYKYLSMQYAGKLPARDDLPPASHSSVTSTDTSIGYGAGQRTANGAIATNGSGAGQRTANGSAVQLLSDSDTIWTCWLQGEEQAPDVVKTCIGSLRKLGRNVVVLTEENIPEYVAIPDYILQKRAQGIINNTHFSDILRVALLSERGGTWIDATVFISDQTLIGEVMENYPLFAYSFVMRDSISDCMLFDSWFLHSVSANPIILDVRDMLYEYWEKEDSLMHYFLFHLTFSIACRRHPEWNDAIPIFSLEPCHLLQHEMLAPYDELRWRHIMQCSGVHKLTYKYDTNANIRGTMLEHLLGL